jgi:hypothetical protein
MADRYYQRCFGAFAKGQIHWAASGGDTFRAVLVDGTYTPDTTKTGHKFLSDIPTGSRHGNLGSNLRGSAPQVLLSDPTDDGVCTSSTPTVTFTTIPATAPLCPYLVIFKDDGAADSSSPLIVLIDSSMGLPLQPNGADSVVTWNTGPTGIHQL